MCAYVCVIIGNVGSEIQTGEGFGIPKESFTVIFLGNYDNSLNKTPKPSLKIERESLEIPNGMWHAWHWRTNHFTACNHCVTVSNLSVVPCVIVVMWKPQNLQFCLLDQWCTKHLKLYETWKMKLNPELSKWTKWFWNPPGSNTPSIFSPCTPFYCLHCQLKQLSKFEPFPPAWLSRLLLCCISIAPVWLLSSFVVLLLCAHSIIPVLTFRKEKIMRKMKI